MIGAAVGLAIMALVLAGPVPLLLARARWPARAPGIALALWQSIALAGGLAMIGSLLVYGLIPFGATLPRGLAALARRLPDGSLPNGTTLAHGLALGAALILGGHLVLNLATTFARAERQRRRHHHLIVLLSDPLPDRPGTRVIAHAAPVAYCLPGPARPATVLSAGLLRLLDGDQVRAVIAHEQAHLRQQHHLVLLAFKSWHNALPWFPIANRAEHAVALLVEMLADDRARRHVDDVTLASAIALVGAAGHAALTSGEPAQPGSPPAAPDRPGDLVSPRVRRLVLPPPPLALPARAGILTAAAGLLALPTLLLLFG